MPVGREHRERPFSAQPPAVVRGWVVFVANVRDPDRQVRLLELGFNRAAHRPRLFWRRYIDSREREIAAVAGRLREAGFKISVKPITVARDGKSRCKRQAP